MEGRLGGLYLGALGMRLLRSGLELSDGILEAYPAAVLAGVGSLLCMAGFGLGLLMLLPLVTDGEWIGLLTGLAILGPPLLRD